MPQKKYYVLERTRRNRSKTEYTRLIDRVYAHNETNALALARMSPRRFGTDNNALSVVEANPGYEKGR